MPSSLPKIRLDQLLVDRGMAESRERAQRLIRAGLVFYGEGARAQRADKPGVRYPADAALSLKGDDCPYVSRGGLKLAGALAAFGIAPEAIDGRRALDIGASTGGFTDCLLQRGAERVWAIDTGRAQLHERLRADPRVVSREQANARQITLEWIGGQPVDWIVIDVSFISLRLILPGLPPLLTPAGEVVALVKPQFEAGAADVGKGGVVRDPATHRRVLAELAGWAAGHGWALRAVCASPLRGPAGNCEFFFRLAPAAAAGGDGLAGQELDIAIEQALSAAYTAGQDQASAPTSLPASASAPAAARSAGNQDLQ